MKIAICDDSYEFACQLKEKLESICAKLDWQMEATVFSSPTALLSADLSAIQVLFLDIDMPGLNGDRGRKPYTGTSKRLDPGVCYGLY